MSNAENDKIMESIWEELEETLVDLDGLDLEEMVEAIWRKYEK